MLKTSEQIKKIISTNIFLSESHGTNWQDAEKHAEQLILKHQSKFKNLNFYERHALIKKLLKTQGVN